jgi:hypothetical protein
VSKHDVSGRESREASALERRGPGGSASALSGRVHDLSVPGGRPLCGADSVTEPPPSPAMPVSCPSCARLLGDAARSKARSARPGAEESED